MHYLIDKSNRYLCLPVCESGNSRKLLMVADGTPVYTLDVLLADETDSTAVRMYVDLHPFLGQNLSFFLDSTETVYCPCLTSEREGEADYASPLRPHVHFSARYGWINDPNGLIFADGVYHMFYQHNPAGVRWGNMHWGHATSADLLHWSEQPEVLYPDKTGTMWSGSAIADTENLLGLKEGACTPILLYYTAAGKPFTQRLAYSADGGVTFRKWDENEPVLPWVAASNRDPKVVWAEEIGKYVMALYLDGNLYALFTSADLLHWEKWQDISLPGDTECPDFYPIRCAETEERLWVFCGASDVYTVGRLEADGFHAVSAPTPYQLGGHVSYAAQSFSGTGDRVVRIAWGRVTPPGAEFCSQMQLPTEITLHRDSDGKYRLATNPIPELRSLYTAQTAWDADISRDEPLRCAVGQNACDVILKIEKTSSPIVCEVFGLLITLNGAANRLTLPGREIPLGLTKDGEWYTVRLIVDTLGVEVFADGGRIYAMAETYPNFQRDELLLYPVSERKREKIRGEIHSLVCYSK